MPDADWIKEETAKLSRMWNRHDADSLRGYLVSDVEDPRLNVQSILTREFLTEELFNARFFALHDQELRFAVVMNWLLELFKRPIAKGDFPIIHYALEHRADNAEGIEVPSYVSAVYATLPARFKRITIPNYLGRILTQPRPETVPVGLDESALALFQRLWRRALAHIKGRRISVLEPACGSANDYRFFASFGLARLLDYTGFDLCERNIQNARALYPKTNFAVGNVLEIAAKRRAYDYTIVHDLFEHLSPPAIERAVAEICRVTRKGLSLGFFNMDEIAAHEIVPVADYHWNKLSMAQMRGLLRRHGFHVQVLHIGSVLYHRFGCTWTHNPNAYTFWAWRADR